VAPLFEIDLVVAIDISCVECLLDSDNFLSFQIQFGQQFTRSLRGQTDMQRHYHVHCCHWITMKNSSFDRKVLNVIVLSPSLYIYHTL
jgi:hypothetical protein